MKKNILTILIFSTIVCLLISCVSRSDRNNESESSDNSYYSENDEENEENQNFNSGCKFEDGTYLATVWYYNPETGYSATYTLNVEVEDCQVIQIIFPNDGYLDNDHITYADIDEYGAASVIGENGKTYIIQIEE